MNSFMLLRHGHVVAEGWWSPYRRRSSPLPVLAEQELHLHGRRAGHRGGETQPGRRGAEVLSRRCPGRAERQPEGDARQRPAPHVHGAAERAAAHAGSALDQDLPGAARPVQARHPFPLQHLGDVHALGHRPEGDGHDRSRLPPAAPVRAAGHRTPDLGNQPARHLGRRFRLEHPHRGHRPLRPALLAEGQVAGEATRSRGVGRGGHRPADLQRQQPEERLGPGLRLPVLALPPRRLSGRRGVRAILRRAARAGCGDRHHQRREGHAGRPEPGLGQTAAGHEAVAAGPR